MKTHDSHAICGPIEPQSRTSEAKPSRTEVQSHAAGALNRRQFFTRLGTATAAAGALGLPPAAGAATTSIQGAKVVSEPTQQRNVQAYRLRLNAALNEFQQKLPLHPDNGDESRYAQRIGNFSKGLPHNDLGEVDPPAYDALLGAASTGVPADFEAIPMG